MPYTTLLVMVRMDVVGLELRYVLCFLFFFRKVLYAAAFAMQKTHPLYS